MVQEAHAAQHQRLLRQVYPLRPETPGELPDGHDDRDGDDEGVDGDLGDRHVCQLLLSGPEGVAEARLLGTGVPNDQSDRPP